MSEADRDRGSSDQHTQLIFQALSKAADKAGIGVFLAWGDGADNAPSGLKHMNDGACALTGYSLAEMAGRSVWALIAPEEQSRVLALRERSEGAPALFETVIARRDGARLPVEVSTTHLELAGRAAHVTFLFDRSQRRSTEDALHRSEASFRSLIEHAPDGICILRWPTIVFVNPTAARLLGYRSAQEAVGKNMMELLRPVEAMRAGQRVGMLRRGERPVPSEYTSRDPDGKPLTVEVSAIPIEYEGAPAVLGFARDVTERRALLQQLTEADKLAAVGTLAAGVAHEINNPLAYLLLNLEFLQRELPKLVSDRARLDPVMKRLDETKQGAERVKTIVRDLQTFTRRDHGIRGPVDLAVVIEAALHLARHELRHRAEIVKNFELLPPVHGNATRLEQLFLNLLINAAHAVAELDPDRNRIEIGLRRAGTTSAVVTVSDNGTGMAPEVLRHAFDPFFTTKPTGVGTGLGLPICQGIVRALGGEIRVTTELGAGTTATVTLPLHRGDEAEVPAVLSTPAGVRRGRVMVIDDERAVAESLSIALREDHEVVTLGSASEARALFGAGAHFDVVLCDLVMPGETGMHLFDHVRETRPELATRFAFMTGGAFLPEAERFLQQVDNPRIEKPFEVAAVRLLVDDMLAR